MYSIFLSKHTDPPTLDGWISLLTLCFAPLIAHIYAGMPQRVHLDPNRPYWFDRAVLLNPTSVLWRYFAILDRRLRSKRWDPYALAASNSVFWLHGRWDGTESTIHFSRNHCVLPPKRRYTEVFSTESLKTIIVTMQGVQALYELCYPFRFADHISLAKIYLPLALFGLLRLLPAPWLTKNFAYADTIPTPSDCLSVDSTQNLVYPNITLENVPLKIDELRPVTTLELRFESYPTDSWRGYIALSIFTALTTSMVALPMSYLIITGTKNGWDFVSTGFVMLLFYTAFTFTTAGIFIHAFYQTIRGRQKEASTVLPCIQSKRYKCYTVLLAALAVALTVLAAYETRRLPCGEYAVVNKPTSLCPGLTFAPQMNFTFETVSKEGDKRIIGSVDMERAAYFGGHYSGYTEIFDSTGALNKSFEWPSNECGNWLDCDPDKR